MDICTTTRTGIMITGIAGITAMTIPTTTTMITTTHRAMITGIPMITKTKP